MYLSPVSYQLVQSLIYLLIRRSLVQYRSEAAKNLNLCTKGHLIVSGDIYIRPLSQTRLVRFEKLVLFSVLAQFRSTSPSLVLKRSYIISLFVQLDVFCVI